MLEDVDEVERLVEVELVDVDVEVLNDVLVD